MSLMTHDEIKDALQREAVSLNVLAGQIHREIEATPHQQVLRLLTLRRFYHSTCAVELNLRALAARI